MGDQKYYKLLRTTSNEVWRFAHFNMYKLIILLGATDVFGVESSDLGNLTKLRIGHDGTGFGSGWFLEKVPLIIYLYIQLFIIFLKGVYYKSARQAAMGIFVRKVAR